jgi:hypothetical protein
VVAADAPDFGEVARGRRIYTARADDRFAEERGDPFGADLLDQREQGFRVVPLDGPRGGHQLAVAFPIAREARQRRTRYVHAVIGHSPPDHDRLARLPEFVPVAAGELGRGVDGVGTARGEEDLAARHRGEDGEPLGEFLGGGLGDVAEIGVVRDRAQLGGHRVGDLAAPVAHVGEPQACGRIEVPVARLVEDIDAVSASDHERSVPLDGAHVGKAMP